MALKKLSSRPSRVLGFLACAVFLVAVLPFFIGIDPMAPHLERTLLAPGRDFWMGTDANGRDIFAQIVFGGRISLVVGLAVVMLASSFGVVAGFAAGYFGGVVDRLFLLVADAIQAFPGVLLAIFIAAFLPPGIINLILLLSFVGWVGYARVVRAQAIEMKSREFVVAARALGASTRRLLLKHFLPNILSPLVVQMSFGMAGAMLAEATLSFLGLGLPEGVPSLGKLMDAGANLLLVAPHVSIFPGLVIMSFVLLFNVSGESLREAWG